jgi:3-oxoacyl-[acyl-carrier protein] reductase
VHYYAAEAGLEGLTRGYASRLAQDGITVNAVAPGPIDTEMAEPLKQTDIATRIPLGRFGTPSSPARPSQ